MKAGIRHQRPATGQTLKRRPLSGVSFVVAVGSIVTMGFAFPETAFAGGNDPIPTITVKIYNYSQAAPAILTRAEREAGRILGAAGLRAVWLDCPVGPLTPDTLGPCEKAPEGTDLRLRVLGAPLTNQFQDTVFGFAIHPVLASVYYEYAVRRAKSDDADFEAPIILGCAIAHELGHLLLGGNSHSGSGIMQPRWESNQFRQLMIGSLVFTTEQSKLMREQVRTRMSIRAEDPIIIGATPQQERFLTRVLHISDDDLRGTPNSNDRLTVVILEHQKFLEIRGAFHAHNTNLAFSSLLARRIYLSARMFRDFESLLRCIIHKLGHAFRVSSESADISTTRTNSTFR
jgi:hypothetical protein